MFRKSFCGVLLVGLFQLMGIQSAHAISLDFVPANQTVVVGNSVTVDVVISGLVAANEIVSAFDLDVTYDSTILTATNVIFGSSLGIFDFFEVFESFELSTSGVVDFAALSALDDTDLSVQGDSVTLATLSFDALSDGMSSLNFVLDPPNDPAPVKDVKGRNAEILLLTVGEGSVDATVAPIPEPSTIFLFGSGLVGLVGMKVFRNRKK